MHSKGGLAQFCGVHLGNLDLGFRIELIFSASPCLPLGCVFLFVVSIWSRRFYLPLLPTEVNDPINRSNASNPGIRKVVFLVGVDSAWDGLNTLYNLGEPVFLRATCRNNWIAGAATC